MAKISKSSTNNRLAIYQILNKTLDIENIEGKSRSITIGGYCGSKKFTTNFSKYSKFGKELFELRLQTPLLIKIRRKSGSYTFEHL